MRTSFFRGIGALIVCACVGMAYAQTPSTVPARADVSWVLPTTATDGTPLTGSQAITKVQGFAATAPIPDNVASAPTVELSGAPTKWSYTGTAPNGATLYFRLRACNLGGCGVLGNQAAKAIAVSVPGVPTGTQVTVTVTVSSP